MIEIGSKEGMITFDESLEALYASGQITYDEATLNARDPSRMALVKPPPPRTPPNLPPVPNGPKRGFFSR
ncbi:MAG: hypothetical protein WDO13_00035 [Verrucomicrobiota bacterium]